MAFTPSSIVYLCGVPLESDLKNQITFATQAAQTAYFQSNIKKQYTNFTYQRKENILRVPANIDDLYNCNYVMYQNSNFTNKWFYAFIVDREYINPNCTHLKLMTDPFQTYMFDITYYNSFVVREHVSDDTIGVHTLPEPVNIGEPVVNANYLDLTFSAETVGDFNNNFWCAVFTTDKIFSDLPLTFYPDNFIGGNACPLYIYAPDSIGNLTPFINYLVSNNKIDSIIAIVPLLRNYTTATAVPTSELPTTFYLISDGGGVIPSLDPTKKNYTITPAFNGLDGYSPVNNKLYTSPYCYGMLQSSNGSKIRIDFEQWANKVIHTVYSATADPSIIAVPYDYRGDGNGAQFSVSFSGFPPIPFKYDTFDRWYSANKNSVDFGIIRKIGEMAGGLTAAITTGNISAAINPALSMETELSKMDDLKNKPDSIAGNISNNPLLYDNRGGIEFFEMTCKYEYARVIDNFFTMYGYCVNDVKNPQNSMNTRPNWNYLETRDINIAGDLPDEDLNRLKTMFNTGVTLWHNPVTFGDYSQNNRP